MATHVLVDTDSTQTLTNKTLTAPILTTPVLTGADIELAADPTSALDAATKQYADNANNANIANGALHAAVSGNDLILSLKTAGNATPTATDSVRLTFRDINVLVGSFISRTVTAATTFTIANGSTMGTGNGIAARLWVGLLDNGGTIELCAWNPLNRTTLALLTSPAPNAFVTTTAEGSGAADLDSVVYSTTARTGKPFILLGYIEITEATAGVWATAPTLVQTYKAGIKKTGDVISSIFVSSSAVATGTTAIPLDDTIPQITEGDEYLTVTTVPQSVCNIVNFSSTLQLAHSTAGVTLTMALFETGTSNAIAASMRKVTAIGDINSLSLYSRRQVGGIISTIFSIRAGGTTGATTTFNGAAGARLMGGVSNSVLQIEEVMV